METKAHNSEEIDVIELVAKGVVGINTAIRKNFKSLILAILIGAVAGAIFYRLVPRRYSSRMMIQSGILTEVYAASITENLAQLIKEENSLEVSKKLSLTKDEASKICKIAIQSVGDKKDAPKEGDLANAFLVTVKVFDNSILPKLQEGILSLLSANEYVKVRENQRRAYCQGMIARVDEELLSLSKMKESLFVNKTKSFDLLLMDPTNIYRMAVELNKEKINYQNQLELAASVQLVEGFTVYDKSFSPQLPPSLMIGALFGVGIVLMSLVYKSLLAVVEISKKKLEGTAKNNIREKFTNNQNAESQPYTKSQSLVKN